MKSNLVIGLICVLLAGLNFVYWQENQALSAKINAKMQQSQWLNQALSAPPDSPANANGKFAGDALALMKNLELEAKRADLDKLLTRMDQLAVGEVQLVFEAVSFNRLLVWFDQVYQSTGLEPHQVSIQRLPAHGSVRAEMVFF